MTTQMLVKKLNREVAHLQKEVSQLKSFAIGMLAQDEEGAYRPVFVREIMRALKEKPRYTFKSKHSFLKQIEKA